MSRIVGTTSKVTLNGTDLTPFLVGAARKPTWFRHPMESRITARRFAARSVRHQFQDFAPQSQSSVDWLNQELKRPNHTAHHRTVTIAGMPYHWTQTYDGVLRLAPGVSPW